MIEDYYYDEIEHELYKYSDEESEDDSVELTQEEWQDWNSEELLNLWMSVVEYHEYWYLPIRKTFNEFCEYVYHEEENEEEQMCHEVQAIKHHPFIKGHNWERFFSLNYK